MNGYQFVILSTSSKEFTMRYLGLCRCFLPHFMKALLLLAVVFGILTGCSKNLSESDVLSKLEAAGLTVERLNETVLTYAQRQRIEAEPESIFSVKLTNKEGQSETMTLVSFSHDWKAENALKEGVAGFAVRNWLFAGIVSVPEIQNQIISALK